MKPVYMSYTQICRALENIPTKEHLNVALCYMPSKQIRGQTLWNLNDAAEALTIYYRKQAQKNWAKQRFAKNQSSVIFSLRAREWLRKAKLVEAIIERWRTEEIYDENCKALV